MAQLGVVVAEVDKALRYLWIDRSSLASLVTTARTSRIHPQLGYRQPDLSTFAECREL